MSPSHSRHNSSPQHNCHSSLHNFFHHTFTSITPASMQAPKQYRIHTGSLKFFCPPVEPPGYTFCQQEVVFPPTFCLLAVCHKPLYGKPARFQQCAVFVVRGFPPLISQKGLSIKRAQLYSELHCFGEVELYRRFVCAIQIPPW